MKLKTGKLMPDRCQLLTLAAVGLLTTTTYAQEIPVFDADAVDTSAEFQALDTNQNQQIEWHDIDATMAPRLEAANLDVRATFEQYDTNNDNTLNEQEFDAFILSLREAEHNLNRLSSSDSSADNPEARSQSAVSASETSYGSSSAEGGMGSTGESPIPSTVNSAAGGEFAAEDTSSAETGLARGANASGTRPGSPAVHSAAGGEFRAGEGSDSREEPLSADRPSSRMPYITEGAETRLDERPASYQSASGQSRDTDSDMQSVPIGQAEYTSRIPQDLVNQSLDSLTDKRVSNSNGNRIGKVEDVVANLRDGKVGFVVSSGGVLGIGERRLLAPVEELALQDDELVWNTTENRKALHDSHTYDSNDFVVITEQYDRLGEVQPGGLSRR